jgi:hypothetical protein
MRREHKLDKDESGRSLYELLVTPGMPRAAVVIGVQNCLL